MRNTRSAVVAQMSVDQADAEGEGETVEASAAAAPWRPWLWIAGCLAEERSRWLLWAPVAIGVGITLYFGLSIEPPGWCGAAALILSAGAGIAGRRFAAVRLAALAVGLIALGFAASQLRTEMWRAPQLRHPIGFTTVTGRVESVERTATGTRATIVAPSIEKLAAERTPHRVRLRFAGTMTPPPSGALVRVRTSLLPPPAPAEPGAYDFPQAMYFMGIGAVGFAFGTAEVLDPAAEGPFSGFLASVDRLRGRIAGMVRAVADSPAAPVTIALLNGEQTGISAPVMDAMRISGLAHLLSISGLHIALVAGIVFFTVRALLALSETAALVLPIKKIAAAMGVLAAAGYILIVGAPVPTLRSVLMTGVVMGAIILDRHPFSPRVFAATAAAVMLMAPDSMSGPSFEMSFGAVAALISGFEVAEPIISRWRQGTGWLGRALIWAGSLALTSVIASLATAPFALYHFQNVTFYGVVANMIAVPLTSVWVMPCGLLSYLLMPFGLQGPVLMAMNWGSDAVVWVAKTVASWPGALMLVPAMPDWGLTCIVWGGLWLLLWRRRWRLLGLPLIVLGMLSPALATRPDVLIADDGKMFAVRDGAGDLHLSSAKGDRIVAETWLHRDGRSECGPAWPARGEAYNGALMCDGVGCVYRKDGRTVAFVRDELALDEDCRRADVVVTQATVRHCRAPVIIDHWRSWREGAFALRLRPEGITVESAQDRRGQRPWTGGPLP